MKLRSKDFRDNENIPPKFTCDGEDISPHLSWENPPNETKSFALSVTDPDAPGGEFIHWLVSDIPKDIRSFDVGRLPDAARQVTNDFGKNEYGGPCPPYGTHRYIFTLYALDTERLEKINKKNFFREIEKHTIEKAQLKGLYKRR